MGDIFGGEPLALLRPYKTTVGEEPMPSSTCKKIGVVPGGENEAKAHVDRNPMQNCCKLKVR